MWFPVLSGLMGGLLGGAVTGTGVVMGMGRWFGDVWLGRMLAKQTAEYSKQLEGEKAKYARELERLRAKIDKSIQVTRAQFDTEFSSFKQAFEAVAGVRIAMGSVRPQFSVEPENETREARLRRLSIRLKALVDAHDKAVEIVENLSPFYPENIYSLLMGGCLNAARLEIADIRTGGDATFSFAWFQEGARRMDSFISSYDAAARAIRDRISTLSIIPA